MINLNQKKFNITIFILCASFLLFITGKFEGDNLTLSVSVFLSVLAVFSVFFESKSPLVKIHYLLFMVAFVFVLLVSNFVANYQTSRLIYFSLNLVLSISIGLLLSERKIVVRNLVVRFYCGFLFLCLVITCLAMLDGQLPYIYLQDKLLGFSYNYISGYLILCFSLYCAYFSKGGMVIPYGRLNSIVIIVFCFLLYGRSGILFSSILSFLVFIYNSNNVQRLMLLSLFSIVIMLSLIYSEKVLELLFQTKFSEGVESPRFGMLKEYFSLIDARSLFFGVSFFDMKTIIPYDYNPHNSYIYLHSTIGVLGLFVPFLILLKASFYREPWFTIFIFVYLLRGMFDSILFPGPLDFLLLSILLMPKKYISNNLNIKA